MTEKKANEIFRSKYPEGEICRKNSTSAGSKYWVTFNKGGKVYYYSSTSYSELLGRFGFKVIYKHDVETAKKYIEKYEKDLNDLLNGVKPPFFNAFGLKSDEEAMADEIAYAKEQVKTWKETLRYYTEDCIID